jgi:hypothetical protein
MTEANTPDLNTAMKMNDVEHAFSQWMLTAPQEQKDHFRQMLNVLMQCYGTHPKVAVVAGVVDRVQGVLVVHALNVNQDEMLAVAQHMLATIDGQLHGVAEDTVSTEVH